jgi:hypothetical protein
MRHAPDSITTNVMATADGYHTITLVGCTHATREIRAELVRYAVHRDGIPPFSSKQRADELPSSHVKGR